LATDPKITFIIKKASVEHIPEIVAIEMASFASPWSARLFYDEIIKPTSEPYVLLKKDGGKEMVVGYIFIWRFYDEIEIANIAVHPDYRRIGIGFKFMNKVLNLYRGKIRKAFLEVRISNTPAQKLYRKLGFVKICIRKKYYSDTNEDAIVMMKEF